MEDHILSVAIAKPPYHCFDYLAPIDSPIEPGQRVQVPFGHTHRMGMVVALKTHSAVAIDRLKPIDHLIDSSPILTPDILALLWWACAYYHHPMGNVIATALPVLLRQDRQARIREIPLWQITPDGLIGRQQLPKKALRQHELLTCLMHHPEGASTHTLDDLGFQWRAPMKACEQKHYVQKMLASPLNAVSAGCPPAYALNQHQRTAIDAVSLNQFQTFLLDGVTGSGKTEVYLQVIERVLDGGQQALMMIPEIGLTPQLLARFEQRFEVPVVTLHSAMTEQERLNHWLLTQSGEAKIVIGTRSSVFCPFQHLGVIIIDEEHDASFKQQAGFRYHARDVAVYRAKQANIPILLGSATASLETTLNVQKKRYQALSLPTRAGTGVIPRVSLADLNQQPLKNGLAPAVISAMEKTLARQEQILVFLNRRGYASVILCDQCGWSVDCQHCDAKMTYHCSDERLRCHHCGSETLVPERCPSCTSNTLKKVGMGTQRLEKYLQQQFPTHTIARIDRDSTRKKGTFEKHLNAIHSGESQILVGTQMLAKGHHFANMTLVCLLEVDYSLVSGDFRAIERLAQQLVQVSGRAGREKAGQVIIQTHQPEHPLLQTLFTRGYAHFSQNALIERQQAALPPFTAQTLLRAEASKRQIPMQFLQEAKTQLSELGSAVQCLGPIPTLLERKQGVFRAQLLIESANKSAMQRALHQWAPMIPALPSAKKVRWLLDIDPLDIL